MPRLDELPPDLRATLSLLVDRGKSYAEVAELLGISEAAVRDRAHAALDRLAGGPPDTDVAAGAAGSDPLSRTPPPPPAGPSATGASPPPTGSGGDSRGGGGSNGSSSSSGLPVSRRGGAILLAGLVAVIVAVVVLVSGGGGGGDSSTNTTGSSTHTTSTGASTKSGKTPAVTSQLTLTATEPGSKAIGLAEVLAEGSEHAIIVAAEHLAPSQGFYYLVWLYNSPTAATPIGRAPTVGSDGRLQGGALLPSNAGGYEHILITRETAAHPTKPGPAVLEGKFTLGR